MIGDTGPFIAVTTPQFATIEFLTAGEVGVRLGSGMNRPDDQPLCVITLAGDFILPPPDPDGLSADRLSRRHPHPGCPHRRLVRHHRYRALTRTWWTHCEAGVLRRWR